uniref:Uncharacterized protein n=1 Tax=Lepeophtheirus salmonis TaxID=72036 RepID=A0A0K2TQU2_LEPSM
MCFSVPRLWIDSLDQLRINLTSVSNPQQSMREFLILNTAILVAINIILRSPVSTCSLSVSLFVKKI